MKKMRPSRSSQPPCVPMQLNKNVRKRGEKSNITAKRVTLLPGFLRRGVKSETVYKATNSTEELPEYEEILNENLHGLLCEDRPSQLRRSSRLLKKNQNINIEPSNYFLKIISDPQSSPFNRSKSIFKEIKEKYAQKVEKYPINHDFGAKLFAQLKPNFLLTDLNSYKEKIYEEAAIINDILSGKLNPIDMSVNRKRNYHEEDKENYPIKFPYVPESKWVFQTPPNRKLHCTHAKVDDNCIKPAILENCKESKVVYEVNNKINVDFSNYSSRQEIDIDKRYMVEVANLSNSSQDITLQFQEREEERAEKKFQFVHSDPYELENHFLSLTCRPKKVAMSVSRIPNLKRKRDIFEPEAGCSTDLETINEFNSSFTFINNLNKLEESFTFKFTANDSSPGATTGHLFDFDGNKKDTFKFDY